MNINLYEFGLDESLKMALECLRGAVGKKLSKNDKDLAIKEAIGIIDTIRMMVVVTNPEWKEESE